MWDQHKEDEEDLVHFISNCKKLEGIRNYELLDKNTNNSEERMRKLLYRDNRCWEVGKMIKDLWDQRRKLLKEIEKEKVSSMQINSIPNRQNDSGSLVDNIQRSSGSGPLTITTQGCNNRRSKNKNLSKGRRTL